MDMKALRLSYPVSIATAVTKTPEASNRRAWSDTDAAAIAVKSNGSKIVMSKVTIPTVGTLLFFEDTEGNIAGVMQTIPRPSEAPP